MLGAEFGGTDLFDGGIAVAAEDGREGSCPTDGWAGVRLPAGLVTGREECGVRVVSDRCDGVVAAGRSHGKNETVDEQRGGERGAALVAGWKKTCLGFDAVRQAISPVCGGFY